MRAAVIAAVVLLAGGAFAKPKRPVAPAAPPAPVLSATVARGADGWRADLNFDGPLLGWALTRTTGGIRVLHVLVGPPRDGPSKDARLYRWQFDAPDRVTPEAGVHPAGALDAADLDGDGADELLLTHDGQIDLVSDPAGDAVTRRTLVTDASIGTACCGPRLAWDEGATLDPVVRVETPGAFRTYRLRSDGALVEASELAIPESVTSGAERVSVFSPPVRAVGRDASGRMLFATDPQAAGTRRLRTILLDPDGPKETQRVESWALFPSAERVVDSAFAMLNGAPVLIVTTTSGDKLSLLGEKALRVYPLSGDRTRAGDLPSFAATTAMNLWQEANPAVVDLDGDGRDDLLIAYWKGLKNAIAAIEVYRGGVNPLFKSAGSMSFDVEEGEKGFMAATSDLDGDGRGDLLLLAHHELVVYPGQPAARAIDKPFDRRPSRRIALPADLPDPGRTSFSMGTDGFSMSRTAGGLGTPHLVDLDGDGRAEAVFAGGLPGGAGRVVVVFVRGGGALGPSSKITPE